MLVVTLTLGVVLLGSAAAQQPQLAAGLSIKTYYAGSLPTARSLALRNAGGPLPVVVYVSSSDEGKVWALIDGDGDGTAERATVLVSGLDNPVGIAWHAGALYLAHWVDGRVDTASGQHVGGRPIIQRLDGVDAYALAGRAYNGTPELVLEDLPADRNHAYHYLRVDPSGRLLLVPQGTPCNICIPPNGQGDASSMSTTHAIISALDLSTGDRRVLATGVRNSVGFDWHPSTEELYFTDNGRDRMGDDLPDCELNRIPSSGAAPAFFGFPFCQSSGVGSAYLRSAGEAAAVADPDVNEGGSVINCTDPASHILPVQPLGPHTAPLGMRFYRRPAGASPAALPAEYDGTAIVALHGSWNRAQLNGYKVLAVKVGDDGAATDVTQLASWLLNEGTPANVQIGRPVDVEVLPDGSLLVSDDGNGAVYRISGSALSKNATLQQAPPPPPPPAATPTSWAGCGTSGRGAATLCITIMLVVWQVTMGAL